MCAVPADPHGEQAATTSQAEPPSSHGIASVAPCAVLALPTTATPVGSKRTLETSEIEHIHKHAKIGSITEAHAAAPPLCAQPSLDTPDTLLDAQPMKAIPEQIASTQDNSVASVSGRTDAHGRRGGRGGQNTQHGCNAGRGSWQRSQQVVSMLPHSCKPSLMERLVAVDVRQDRNLLLQVFRCAYDLQPLQWRVCECAADF